MGEVAVDNVPATSANIEKVIWYCCFKHGCAQSSITGGWRPVCIGHHEGRGGIKKFHPYTSKCMVNGVNKAGHGYYTSSAERKSIVLYDAKLTGSAKNLAAATKQELWKLRAQLNVNGGIPNSFSGRV
mmetsp:Transcript_33396/g.83183  ORF Transcript_33396/g.83183 Transcript_33396/m.83183 type:complete len:128 (+) Transcript_33396:606-989(+)